MEGDQPSSAERADAEALDWIVRLHEDAANPNLRHAFEVWQSRSTFNAEAWAEASRIYAGIGDLPPAHESRWRHLSGQRTLPIALPIHRPTHCELRSHARKRLAQAPLLIAGVLAAAFALLTYLGPKAAIDWQADAVTGTAEVRTIAFADGSTATLAPDSAIRTEYAQGARHVILLRGEAWFSVRHDADHPFRVSVGPVDTTDLGTEFDVKLGATETSIAVGSGSVRVDDLDIAPPVSERLTDGQQLTVGGTGQVVRGQESGELIGSWRAGQLSVIGRPMRSVINALRPWYSGIILVRADALADRPVTGVYDLHNPAAALDALAKAYGAKVTRVTPWLLVLSQRG